MLFLEKRWWLPRRILPAAAKHEHLFWPDNINIKVTDDFARDLGRDLGATAVWYLCVTAFSMFLLFLFFVIFLLFDPAERHHFRSETSFRLALFLGLGRE